MKTLKKIATHKVTKAVGLVALGAAGALVAVHFLRKPAAPPSSTTTLA